MPCRTQEVEVKILLHKKNYFSVESEGLKMWLDREGTLEATLCRQAGPIVPSFCQTLKGTTYLEAKKLKPEGPSYQRSFHGPVRESNAFPWSGSCEFSK